jgi:uncharacterized damage-inducible protein DinB
LSKARFVFQLLNYQIAQLLNRFNVGDLMTETELEKHLEAAEKSPKQVAAAVSGLPEKVLRYKPAPDKWSIHEILGHLADVEIVYAYRLRQMLADKKPVIAPMDQDDWTRNLAHQETPPAELVALYGLNRHANLRLLQRLKPADFEKSAYHPETKQDFSVAQLIERMATHGTSHLEQIERLKKEAGRASDVGPRTSDKNLRPH